MGEWILSIQAAGSDWVERIQVRGSWEAIRLAGSKASKLEGGKAGKQ